jgi:hypothetical protein
MKTYKLTFDNGAKFQATTENLDQAHTKIVKYINDNKLTQCIIICPNGVTRRVRKTGGYHWNHNGFAFD